MLILSKILLAVLLMIVSVPVPSAAVVLLPLVAAAAVVAVIGVNSSSAPHLSLGCTQIEKQARAKHQC
jgi:hypothetical protein